MRTEMPTRDAAFVLRRLPHQHRPSPQSRPGAHAWMLTRIAEERYHFSGSSASGEPMSIAGSATALAGDGEDMNRAGGSRQRYRVARNTLAAFVLAGTAAAPSASPASADLLSSFSSVVPARLLETRSGPGLITIDGQFQGGGAIAAGTTTELLVAGRANVPSDATAVVLNVTATDTHSPGYVTVYPCGTPQPTASNLNYTTGQTIPNAVITKIGTDGKVCLYTLTTTHLIADINGYFPAGSSFDATRPRPPARHPSPDRPPSTAKLEGHRHSPSRHHHRTPGHRTRRRPHRRHRRRPQRHRHRTHSPGFVTVYPCGTPQPNASNLNYTTGQTIPNAVITKIGTDGKVCLYTLTTTHLIADINGYFPAGSSFDAVDPARLLDTRARIDHHRRPSSKANGTRPAGTDHSNSRSPDAPASPPTPPPSSSTSPPPNPQAPASSPSTPAAHPNPPPPTSTTPPARPSPTPSSPKSAPAARSASTPSPPPTSSPTSTATSRPRSTLTRPIPGPMDSAAVATSRTAHAWLRELTG